MPRYAHACVDIACVLAVHMAERLAQAIDISRRDHDINMIGHQTIRPYLNTITLRRISEKIKIQRVIKEQRNVDLRDDAPVTAIP